MSKKDDRKDKVQTAESADLEPTTADAEETKAGTPAFHAYDPTFRGGVYVAAGDIN